MIGGRQCFLRELELRFHLVQPQNVHFLAEFQKLQRVTLRVDHAELCAGKIELSSEPPPFDLCYRRF